MFRENLFASACLAIALMCVAVVTAAVGQTSPTGTSSNVPMPSASAGQSGAPAQAMPLRMIPQPRQLKNAGVLDATGKPIGKVADLTTDTDGKASRVQIALATPDGMGRTATVNASKFLFDPARGALVAKLSPTEVQQLAADAK